MLKLGLTGGIGSGKSFVCQLCATMGVPIYNTDQRAKVLYNESANLKHAMIALLGNDIYDDSGEIQRRVLAEMLFADASLLKQVEALVHPEVRFDLQNWYECRMAQGYKVCIVESALLLTSRELRGMVDGVVSVVAHRDQKIMRTMQRDKCSWKQVEARMKQQPSDDMWLSQSDFIIDNTGDVPLLPQINAMFYKFID